MMAKYMVLGNYNAQGAAGVIAQGGTARVTPLRRYVSKSVESSKVATFHSVNTISLQ
jgi:hypothetical protein